MRDADNKIAQLWKEVWDDGGAAAGLAEAVGDFGTVLEEKLLLELVLQCKKALADVSWSRRASGASALRELADNQILAPLANRKESDQTDLDAQRSERRRIASHLALDSLVKVLSGPRLWSGKSEVTNAAVRIASNWASENGSSLLKMKRESNCDLFAGDEWFKQSHEDVMDAVENEASQNAAQSPQAETSPGDLSDMETNLQDEQQDDNQAYAASLVPVNFLGLCQLLIVQGFPSKRSCMAVSDEEILPYRSGALEAFKDLLGSLGSTPDDDDLRKGVYESTSEKLLSVFNFDVGAVKEKSKEPPLVVARSLDCYGASLCPRVGSKDDVVDSVATAKMLLQCLEQPAWTVREAAAMCCASLVSKSDELVLCQFDFLSVITSIVTKEMKDRKFWRVRLAGMKLLHSLVIRVPKGAQNSSSSNVGPNNDGAVSNQEILESVLPHKEAIMLLAKRSLSDPEAKVTAVGSQKKRDVIEDLRKMYEGETLDRANVHEILRDGTELLSKVDTIYDIAMPKIELEEDAQASKKSITIVGDIHGNLPNMIHLFKVNGFPSLERPYIFNGDFTDKGEQGLECLLSLLMIKLYCNECMYLHVGNHETQSFYPKRFRTQITEKYDEETYQLVREVLLQLPLGAVIDDRIFVVHAGIPKKDFNLEDLRHYKRGKDYDRSTLEGVLFRRSVWADPTEGDSSSEDTPEDETNAEEDQDDVEEFKVDPENDDDRGWYTAEHTETFLRKHDLEYIVRGHENFVKGFQYHHDARVVTIHSNPSRPQDQGAYLNIYSNDGSMVVEQFSGVQFSSLGSESKVDWRSL
ncbi:MAG: hypothetical protein SGBAC_012800 [Bacillariaceae sp.]